MPIDLTSINLSILGSFYFVALLSFFLCATQIDTKSVESRANEERKFSSLLIWLVCLRVLSREFLIRRHLRRDGKGCLNEWISWICCNQSQMKDFCRVKFRFVFGLFVSISTTQSVQRAFSSIPIPEAFHLSLNSKFSISRTSRKRTFACRNLFIVINKRPDFVEEKLLH